MPSDEKRSPLWKDSARTVPGKVAGTWPYVHNVRIPGMVHGRVIFPSGPGATLVSVDEDSVRGVPGLIRVVRKRNFLGVVAEREEQAIQAAGQLRVTWSGGVSLPQDKYDWLRNAKKIRGYTRLSGGPGGYSYEFENDRTITHYVEELLRAIYMRGPGSYQTCFAVETFMDELAAEVKADPIEFRLRHLKDPNAIAVTQAVAKKSSWQPRPSSTKSAANPRGIATGRGACYATSGRKSAVIANVEVNLERGKVRVTKAVIAVTCGRIINPEGMRHQLQGGLIQGMSRSLMEEIKYDQSRVTDSDWRSYPILRFPEIPEIETILIDQPDADPDGVGETASIPTAAAVGNAIFDATGVRLREIPFTPERVRAALAKGRS